MMLAYRSRSFSLHSVCFGAAVLVFSLAGCTKEQDYLDVLNDQQAALREMTEILKTIKDQQTMDQAKRTLRENAEKYAAISERANSLPKPPPPRVQERMKQESGALAATLLHLRAEAKRVGDLPGGAEFLRQFKSTEGLMTAVQP